MLTFQKRFGKSSVRLSETNNGGALRITSSSHPKRSGIINFYAAALEDFQQRAKVIRWMKHESKQLAFPPGSHRLSADFIEPLQPLLTMIGSMTQQSKRGCGHVVGYVFQMPLATPPHRPKIFRYLLRVIAFT